MSSSQTPRKGVIKGTGPREAPPKPAGLRKPPGGKPKPAPKD